MGSEAAGGGSGAAPKRGGGAGSDKPASGAGAGAGGAPRSTQGRTAVRGRNRVVDYLRFTELEIGQIREGDHRASREFAIAAFFFGLFVDTLFILAISAPTDKGVGGALVAVLVISICLAAWFANQGRLLRKSTKDTLQDIIDQHDKG